APTHLCGVLLDPVCLTSAFHAYRRKDPAFAGSVSLNETRERDVLATSRLALAAFLWPALLQSPLGKSKRSNEKSPGLGLGSLCCGSLFSSPGGCADRSSRAADRVRLDGLQ